MHSAVSELVQVGVLVLSAGCLASDLRRGLRCPVRFACNASRSTSEKYVQHVYLFRLSEYNLGDNFINSMFEQ